MPDDAGHQKVLLVASGGGHWVQLMRMVPAFAAHRRTYVTTLDGYNRDVGTGRVYVVNDANRCNKFGLLRMALRLLLIVLRERPDLIVSTGAAPGYFAVRFGKLMGARTVWVDSIANVDCLSLSGRRVAAYADMWLTQWPHLSRPNGPHYRGAVV
jgi:UDP-N-acetylglucosamine:LPS N-acetylglucosamine transferase